MMMMRTVTVMTVMMSLSESITKFDRRRQIGAGAGGDLLGSHCIERAACMRRGDNMLGWDMREHVFTDQSLSFQVSSDRVPLPSSRHSEQQTGTGA